MSEPSQNVAMIREGERLLAEVTDLETEHADLGAQITAEQTKQGAPPR